jgi:hypothetical protein
VRRDRLVPAATLSRGVAQQSEPHQHSQLLLQVRHLNRVVVYRQHIGVLVQAGWQTAEAVVLGSISARNRSARAPT